MIRPPRARVLLFLVLLAGSARPQNPVPADRLDAVAQKFGRALPTPSLTCDFRPLAPKLDFALHFESGYDLRFPFRQFDPTAHEIEILVKIAAESPSSTPLFLFDHSRLLSAQTNLRADGQITGRFSLDPGAYRIEAIATDETGRSCHAQWKTSVKLPPYVKPPDPAARQAKTTVFLDAASLTPRASSLQPSDVKLLTQTLSALLAHLAPDSVRLVVFNAAQESELLRIESLTASSLDSVGSALASLQLGTVDIHDLRERTGPAAFVATLLQKEAAAEPSRRIVFLGPCTDPTERAPKLISAASPSPASTIFYLQYRDRRPAADAIIPSLVAPPASPRYGESEYPVPTAVGPVKFERRQILWGDIIEQIVRQAGGRTIIFTTPEDFASALNHLPSAQ